MAHLMKPCSAKLVAHGLIMVCIAAAVQSQTAPDSSAGSKILALENAWNNAERLGDTGALNLIFDEAMVYIDEDGALLTKAQFLEQIKQSGAHLQSLVTEGVSVHVYGETALVVGNYRVTGVERGTPYRREGRFIDSWVFKDQNWVCVAAQATPVLR